MIINWSVPALDNLDTIYEYISRDAPLYAQHVVQDLMAAVDRLTLFPDSGRHVPEITVSNVEVSEVIARGYRIFYYRVNDTRIDIIGVRSSYQDLTQNRNQPWDQD
jgi:toxin ParE1/3/4